VRSPDHIAHTGDDVAMPTSRCAHLSAPWTALVLVAVYAVGLGSVVLRPADNPVAVWWPAAGLSVALVALTRPGRRELALVALALVVATGLSNLTGGRSWQVSLFFGVANTAEALVAGLVLRASTAVGAPRIGDLRDLLRLVVATVLGAATIALLLLAAAGPLGLGVPLEVSRTVFTSHAAAVLLVVPAVLVPRRPRDPSGPDEQPAPRGAAGLELPAQVVVTTLATAAVFVPQDALPLTFVPLVPLTWAALRLGPRPLALLLEERNRLFDEVRSERRLFRANFTDSLVGQLLLREGPDGLRVDEANQTAADLLGRSPDDLVGCEVDEVVVVEDGGLAARLVRPGAGGGAGSAAGWRGRGGVAGRADARVSISVSRISAGAGAPVWSVQLLDITAEQLAHRRLSDAEKLTSATLDTTAAIILVTDLDARIVRVNAATAEMTGYTEADLVGRRLWETTLAPDSAHDLESLFLWPNRSGAPVVREHDAVTLGGERRRIVWSNNLVRDEDGMPAYAVLTGIDVTTERASAGLVTHLMQAAVSTAIVGLDARGRISVVNSGAEHLLHRESVDLVGLPFTMLLDPEQLQARLGCTDHDAVFAALTASLGEEEQPNRDWWWVDGEGERRVVSMSLSATGSDAGAQVGFLCVGRDVTEQRRAQDLVVAALEKERTAVERLQAIDEAKNEFVSTVSHELRTPVTSIVGYTELLQDGTLVAPADDQLPLLDSIARNGQRLIVLCNDLLLLSGLDSGDVSWKAEEVDLAALLEAVREATAALLVGRDLDVAWERPAHPVVALGDGSQLERVLLNLVGNALKFTEDGGVVRVRLESAPGEAVLVVSDTGIGIPVEEQDGLFERFFRSSTAQEQAIQGTGLGLSIVSSVVQAHGGSIAVRSAHLEGSTFTVRLPLKS
jgi:PAS domain S-box-containing protein